VGISGHFSVHYVSGNCWTVGEKICFLNDDTSRSWATGHIAGFTGTPPNEIDVIFDVGAMPQNSDTGSICHGPCLLGYQGYQGYQGFQGYQGYQGFQGLPGLDGPQGFQGEEGEFGIQGPVGEKPAILKTADGYRELACIEAPEVLFFDVVEVKYSGVSGIFNVDRLFVEVCEPSTVKVISIVPGESVQVAVRMISDGSFELKTVREVTMSVVIILSGLRKGFSGRRFVQRTKQEYERNVKFWNKMWMD
jgi:hypothetical protein